MILIRHIRGSKYSRVNNSQNKLLRLEKNFRLREK